LTAVVARRLGLYSSSEKKPFARSNGEVFSFVDINVVFRPRTLDVSYLKLAEETLNWGEYVADVLGCG
jgi:hypothetical protein